ncbi:MAG: methyl-accepting chemotaxis protein [Stappia sp.]|uniref:methyl-accepting chemotaxis protein n=1 Tax=Stappia sp. TaxID=1870903 RepID=UPI000C57CE92|nr:methyl-accepting chemotaxis protein [Stappia sp.]MAA99421.1 methyl-accepting chemotaxis protein [Stappia sp.]MBM22434.1 methyl-accepting chemotaxis protein [Stappia sp.]
MSLRTLLISFTVALLTAVASLVWVGLSGLAAVNSSAEEMAKNWLPSVSVVNAINTSTSDFRIYQAEHIISVDEASMRAAEKMLADIKASIDSNTRKYEKLISSSEEQGVYDGFKEKWDHYLKRSDEVVELSRQNKNAEATVILRDEIRADFDSLSRDLATLIELNEQGSRASATQAEAEYAKIFWVFTIAASIAGLIGLVYIYYIVAHVTRNIVGISGAMSQIAGGDFDAYIPCAGRKNELGDMANTLQTFRDSLRENERLRAEQVETEARNAEKALSQRRALADQFESTMGQLVQSLVRASGEVASAAEGLSANAEETSRQAQAVSGAAEEASTNVQTVAVGAEELSASINEITSQVERSVSISKDAATTASMTSHQVNSLSEAAQKIGEVVELITTIAEQTNLLALNATIEAARAGEAGKGFAVVAAEVKGLASQTARATEEISGKITEIQAATRTTVDSISQIVSTIGTIQDAAQAISIAVEQQGAATSEIATNINRAASGANEVTDNISGVGTAAEMTGAASTQLMGLSSALSGQSRTLEQEVSQFLRTLRAA